MDAADAIAEDISARYLVPIDVLYQFIVTTVTAVVMLILFLALRPKNKIFYEPKMKYHPGKPPWTSSGILGWVSTIFRTKEHEIIEKIGLDAATFLRFVRMMRTIFLLVALFDCAILIPINVLYNLRDIDRSDRDSLSILTIRDVEGRCLWAHIGIVYVNTAIVIIVVWFNWRAMVRLRIQYFLSPEYVRSSDATLTVIHIPEMHQSDEGIKSLLSSIHVPYPIKVVHIGRDIDNLPHLIEVHNKTVRKFELVLERYLKGGQIGKKRPTIRVGGFLGIGGELRDAIDYYTERLQQTEKTVEERRSKIDTHRPMNYGFVSIPAVPCAHADAELLEHQQPKGAKIILTPNPKDIIWENLNKTRDELIRSKMLGWSLLIFLVFLSLIPLAALSFLAKLYFVANFVPFLRNWEQASGVGNVTFKITASLLPPVAYRIFYFLFERMIFRLSRYKGAATRSRLQNAILARHFAFMVISELIIFSFIGIGFNIVTQIIQQIKKHQSLNGTVGLFYINLLAVDIDLTSIDQTSYWLTFFLYCIAADISELVELPGLVWNWVKKYIFRRKPSPREAMQPPEIEFPLLYAYILFLGTVGLVFAPLAPLVPVGAVLVIWIDSWVLKYKLMFRYVSFVENAGRLWNPAINRFLVSLLLMQALMLLIIGLQFGWKSSAVFACIPPFITVALFKVYINRNFTHPFKYYVPEKSEPQEALIRAASYTNENHNENCVGHPAFHEALHTPVLYPNMMPLLAQVYSGRLDSEQTMMRERSEQQIERDRGEPYRDE